MLKHYILTYQYIYSCMQYVVVTTCTVNYFVVTSKITVGYLADYRHMI